jgi:hypothetical protein
MKHLRRGLVLLGAALALTGCAQEQTRFCTTVGCLGVVSVDLDGAVADRITGPTMIRACLASACATSVVLPGEQVGLTLTGTEFEIDTIDLTVVATSGGSEIFAAAIPVTGERINGAGCSPVCFQTGVVVTEADLSA